MAQSKTVASALFVLAFAAAAAASVAQASASEITPGRKLLAGDGMIPFNENDLMPLSAGQAVTSGRAAGVAIQRQLLAGDGMIAINENDLMPLSAGKAVTSGRAAGVAVQRELREEDDWFPKEDFDKARSGVAGVQSQRQLIADMVPFNENDLLPLSAAEGLTKGRAGGVSIQKDLTGGKVPAA